MSKDWEPTLEVGRTLITKEIFRGHVTGGGKNGPGIVYQAAGIGRWDRLSITLEKRSKSLRSGFIKIDLHGDGLYRVKGAAHDSSSSLDFYFCVGERGVRRVLKTELNELLKELFPDEAKAIGLDDLPELMGSDAQVAWANDLRLRFAEKSPEDPRLQSELKARYWIDNRFELGLA
jgi:hypothetical protein